MYSIYIKAPREDPNSILIYDDLDTNESYLLIDPTLSVGDNVAGSLDVEVPMSNAGYSLLTPYLKNEDIFIYKQGYNKEYAEYGKDDIYWSGRIIDVNIGIENHKSVYCEGVLGFLNDTIQTPGKYTTETDDNTQPKSLKTYLEYLLETRHNSQVSENRKIYLGIVMPKYDPTDWFTNYESTMDIFQNIIEITGGHLRIHRGVKNNKKVWILDLLTDDVWINGEKDSNDVVMDITNKWKYYWIPNIDQQIEYGINLTDLSQNQTLSNIVTVVYPTGKRKDSSAIEGVDEYYTIDGCDESKIPDKVKEYISVETDNQGFKYIRSSYSDIVGKIAISVNHDDVTDPTELLLLGILSLTLPNTITYEVEASAIDASYRDRSLKPIEVCDVIDIVSVPHKLVEAMKVSNAEIPLADPSSGKYTIGTSRVRTFTDFSTKQNKKFFSELRYLTVKPYEPPQPDPPEEREA